MTDKKSTRAANLAYASVAGQAGCFTIVLVFTALFIGLWLDNQIGVRGPFTVGLLLLSVPVSLIVMVRIALSAIKEIQPPPRSRAEDDASPSNTE